MAGPDPAISSPVGARVADHRAKPGDDEVRHGLDPPLVGSAGNLDTRTMRGGWVYMVTNRPNRTLYLGVTGNLARRAWEHREGALDGFSKKYRLKRLVWAERHDDIRAAIQREKNLKHWPRAWKIDLILAENPEWDDLWDHVG